MSAAAVPHMKYEGFPQLQVQAPVCGHCYDEVTIEGAVAVCDACQIVWDRVEDTAPSAPKVGPLYVPCLAERGPLAGKLNGTHAFRPDGSAYDYGLPQPCILPLGHASSHRHPIEVTVVEVQP